MNIRWNSYPDKKPNYTGIFLVRLNNALDYLFYSSEYGTWGSNISVTQWYDLGVFLHEVNTHCLTNNNLTE
jgi:hypothetical protein